MMNNRGNIFIIAFVILIIAILVFFTFYYVSNSGPIRNFIIPGNGSLSVIQTNYTTPMFYSGMRFNHLPVLVYIEPDCNSERVARVNNALQILEEKTILNFTQSASKDADIDVMCSSSAKNPGARNYGTYIAGEGGPTQIISTGKFYVIKQGEISLYNTPTDCKSPNVEIHELLHVFGFDHSSDPSSIMYPYSRCNQEFTSDLISTIDDIYSQKPLPDFFLSNLTLKVYTKYLIHYADFKVTIGNQGIVDAGDSKLKVYANGKLIGEFGVSSLEYGSSSVLTVNNLKAPQASSFKFVIIYNGEEYNFGNNELVAETG